MMYAKLYYMVQALFSLFFTDFDFQSLEADINEYEALDGAKDFGSGINSLIICLTVPVLKGSITGEKLRI